jgi:hypothetical protein
MNVLHLWAIGFGAAAIALPVAVHLLTKPRPVRYETSTLRFLRGALSERRARHRLRDFVLLGLRTAAIALAAAAFARPFFGEPEVTASGEAATRVVLVDAGQSMAAAEHGIPAFERARAAAAEQLTYRPGLTANLILAAARAEPTFARPSTNFAALRDELGRAAVRAERLDVAAALAAAAAMFDGPPSLRRELIIVSDFQRNSWSRADFSVIPADVKIAFESVAPTSPPANVAIVGTSVRSRTTQGREAVVEIEAANYGPLGRSIDVELRFGDAMQRLQGSCAPYAQTVLTAEFAVEGDDWQWGEARLVGVDDALAADDVRPVVGRLRSAPRTALVTRQPAARRPSSAYFLATALEPTSSTAEAAPRLLRVDPSQAGPELAAGCDVVVLDRPGKLGDEWIAYLIGAARRGRVLFYVAEEPIDATNLHRLAAAADRDWRFPVNFAPPPVGRQATELFLAEVKVDRPPFSVFGEQAATTIAPLRFHGGLATTPRSDALADDVLAYYGDRTCCLAVGAVGAGRIAVLNADLETSLLPRTEAFVPLVGELLDSLLDRSGAVTTVECGLPLAAYLPVDVGPAAALTPRDPNETAVGRLRDETLGVFWEVTPVGTPGVYRALQDEATVFAAAAVIPAEESDLRTLPADVLTERLAGGRTTAYHGVATRRTAGDRWWVWLVTACVGCMLAEIAAMKWFRT